MGLLPNNHRPLVAAAHHVGITLVNGFFGRMLNDDHSEPPVVS